MWAMPGSFLLMVRNDVMSFAMVHGACYELCTQTQVYNLCLPLKYKFPHIPRFRTNTYENPRQSVGLGVNDRVGFPYPRLSSGCKILIDWSYIYIYMGFYCLIKTGDHHPWTMSWKFCSQLVFHGMTGYIPMIFRSWLVINTHFPC